MQLNTFDFIEAIDVLDFIDPRRDRVDFMLALEDNMIGSTVPAESVVNVRILSVHCEIFPEGTLN
jgi:hypothetical protein